MVLGTLRQQVATVLAERTMAATVSHNDRNGYQPFLYDVLKVEYVRGDDNQRSMKMSVRVNADAAPHLLAMFEQVAPNCVHVNVPWSRREEIGRMLFAQAAPPESEPVKTPARAVFAQTLESWLSEEFRSLRGDADGPTSRPNGAKSPEIAHAAANDEPAARRAGAEKAEVSMDKGIPPAATVIGAQILIPDSLRRIPKIVYSRGGELVQSLFGSLIEPRPKLEKVDAVILEIEIITPRGASAD